MASTIDILSDYRQTNVEEYNVTLKVLCQIGASFEIELNNAFLNSCVISDANKKCVNHKVSNIEGENPSGKVKIKVCPTGDNMNRDNTENKSNRTEGNGFVPLSVKQEHVTEELFSPLKTVDKLSEGETDVKLDMEVSEGDGPESSLNVGDSQPSTSHGAPAAEYSDFSEDDDETEEEDVDLEDDTDEESASMKEDEEWKPPTQITTTISERPQRNVRRRTSCLRYLADDNQSDDNTSEVELPEKNKRKSHPRKVVAKETVANEDDSDWNPEDDETPVKEPVQKKKRGRKPKQPGAPKTPRTPKTQTKQKKPRTPKSEKKNTRAREELRKICRNLYKRTKKMFKGITSLSCFIGKSGGVNSCTLCGEQIQDESFKAVFETHLYENHMEEFKKYHMYFAQYMEYWYKMDDKRPVKICSRENSKTDEISQYICLLCDNGDYIDYGHIPEHHPNITAEVAANYVVSPSIYTEIQQGNVQFYPESATLCCLLCNTIHQSPHGIEQHLTITHQFTLNPEKLYCHTCKVSFTEERFLILHNIENHKKYMANPKTSKCPFCEEVHYVRGDLRRHIFSKHGSSFKCPLPDCSEEFYEKTELFSQHLILQHLSSTSNIEEFYSKNKNKPLSELCNFCGKVFNGHRTRIRRSYLTHLENYHQERIDESGEKVQYPCPLCNDKFFSRITLERHDSRVHHNESVKCPYENCNAEFRGNYFLKSHIRSVHKAKQHQCHLCGKQFKYKSLLTHVKTIHENIRDIVCPFEGCGKMFGRYTSLDVHMRIHRDEKPLKCEYCDFRGRQRNNINSHKKTHHKDKLNMSPL